MADHTASSSEGDEAVVPQPPPPPATYWTPPEARNMPVGPAPGYEYVGFWRRAMAALIDGFMLTIVSYAIFIPLVLSAMSAADTSALSSINSYTIDPGTGAAVPSAAAMAVISRLMGQVFRAFGIVILVQAAYFVILWSWRGGSLGQIALGIEVRQESDGRRIGFWRSCLRYLGFLISGWALLIGFIWVAFDGRKQGWHDKIAGTLVVRRVG